MHTKCYKAGILAPATMQQVHSAGAKSNELLHYTKEILIICLHIRQNEVYLNVGYSCQKGTLLINATVNHDG